MTCYCGSLKPFVAPFPVGILQHPYEQRNAIATARMAHLSIQNSRLFVGRDFTAHLGVNALLSDTTFRHVMLYPGPDAMDLDDCFQQSPVPDERELFVWVLDAKWQHVHQMLRMSDNVAKIPMVRFDPVHESRFIIRKQPKPFCLSTIESIHVVIDHFFKVRNMPNQEHHALLDVFQFLVQQQLEFARVRQDNRHIRNKSLWRVQNQDVSPT